MKNRNKKGFTLVELVIVIAVIAILAGVMIGTFAGVINRAQQSKALQEWKATVDAVYVDYVADEHELPQVVVVGANTVTFDKLADLATSTEYYDFKYVEGTVPAAKYIKLAEATDYAVVLVINTDMTYQVAIATKSGTTYKVGGTVVTPADAQTKTST